jgi:hypothetical protein
MKIRRRIALSLLAVPLLFIALGAVASAAEFNAARPAN